MKIIERYPAPVFIDVNEPLHYPKPYSEAVCEYQIENSLINSNGYILKGFKIYKEPIAFTHREDLVFKNIISFYLKKRIRTELPVISMLHGWSDNFYHFTLECLPKLYVLKEHLSNSLVLFPKELKQFHKDWIDILELKNVILVSDNQIVSSPLSISCTFTSQSLYHHPIIIPEFKNWVLSKLKRSNKFNFKKVFIGRKANWRVILNFDEVKVFLNGLGFDYIEMEDYSVFEQIEIFNNAEKIVAIHGAALTHLAFANKNTNIIDLIHEDFFQFCYESLSIINNVNYYRLPCKGKSDDTRGAGYRDLIVDLNTLSNYIANFK